MLLGFSPPTPFSRSDPGTQGHEGWACPGALVARVGTAAWQGGERKKQSLPRRTQGWARRKRSRFCLGEEAEGTIWRGGGGWEPRPLPEKLTLEPAMGNEFWEGESSEGKETKESGGLGVSGAEEQQQSGCLPKVTRTNSVEPHSVSMSSQQGWLPLLVQAACGSQVCCT